MNTIMFYKDSKEVLMALMIRNEHSEKGINFLTENDCFQQVAYMGHEAGHVIIPHYHNRIKRIVDYTCETLIVKKGLLKVTIYEDMKPRHIFNMKNGDVLTLYSGGHGFEVIEDTEMIEIKQGPFMGPEDKTRFDVEEN